MKALVKERPEAGLVLKEIPVPQISDDDVLIKIKKMAICGTDVHIWKWNEWAQKTIPVPMQVGHEYVGEICKIGKNVNKQFKEGMRVSGEGHLVCGVCRNCRAGTRHLCLETKGIGVNVPGSFAEYLRLPISNVFKLPDNISDDEAAIFDPFGNAVHTALSFNLVGEDVLITGAGPIGIMAAAVAMYVGARHVVITDMNEYRLELAKKMGIKNVVNVRHEKLSDVMNRLHMSEGFDVGMEVSGASQAFSDMVNNMRANGRIALLGIIPDTTNIPWGRFIFKGLQLKGVYGREMYETWYKMTALIEGGLNIKNIITHHFHINQYKEAFETMVSGNSGKIILNW